MRQARFSGVAAEGQEPFRSRSLVRLILSDFRAPTREVEARIAGDRARSVGIALPLLVLCRLACWAAVAATLLPAHGLAAAAGPMLALGTVVALDLILCFALRRAGRIYVIMRLALLQLLASTALSLLAAWLALSVAPDSALVRIAIVASVAAGIPAFFTVAALLLATCCALVATVAAAAPGLEGAAVAGAVGAYVGWLAVLRARDFALRAEERLATEEEACTASRLIADFEESGRGWFWETSAEGLVTYVSRQLAASLGRLPEALLGARLSELLLVQAGGRSDDEGRGLAFHLSARFPFEDVLVSAPGSDLCWALSGRPTFDPFGRFLGFRGIGSNVSEQRRREVESSNRARYDGLTGIPNRSTMRTMLDEALANAAERRKGCALMMIDLDRFKQVNDTLGHPVGDKLLKQVAGRLAEALGEEAQVGRLGGDEFEAILPAVDTEGRLSALAEGLIRSIAEPFDVDGHDIRIGASVGIAIARPGKAYAAALVKEADLALYAAKAGGRGTFRFFAAEMHEEAADRQILEADLRSALGKDQLRLLFQPIVDSVSEEVVAFEALLRWHHPTRGVLAPAAFLSVAEESGLMPGIGSWVLRSACAEAAKWPAHVRLGVNLSGSQLRDPALASNVIGALAANGVEPDRLELEIGETFFLADPTATGQVLDKLKALGVRLALDNFGTGLSGLAHLRRAPVDKIKIDRSFVRGAAGAGGRDAAIIRAIVVLAESLGIDTTAEGTESLEELALVRRLGCSQVQGFLFGRPAAPAKALEMARESRPTAEIVGFSRPPRHRLIRLGTLQWDGRAYPARVRNISSGGAMVECETAIPPDRKVKLDLDEAGLVPAEVRWCQRGQMGLKFEREFDLRTLARARRGPAGPKTITPGAANETAPPMQRRRS
ncbi:MAG TPA: EAL domain-containing protein [Allosphingosinicella sp.]|jgi:diguanylate cyclase (GGDEF)-like protein